MASRDRDKPAAGLLRRSLAHPAGAEADCPPPDILAAYYERSLDAAETARYELHFSQCAHCREKLAAISRVGEFAAAADESTQHNARWVWLWDWRWLAPAAAVLAIVIVWAARRPAPTRTPGQTPPPLVAMSRPAELPATSMTRESLPETSVAVPRSSSAAESAARTAPNSISSKALPSASETLHVLAEKKPARPATNLPLAGRNYSQLDTLAKSAEAPKSAAAQSAVAAGPAADISAGALQSASSSAPPPPPPAPAPAANRMATSESVVVEAEVAPQALKTKREAPPAKIGRYTAGSAKAVLETAEQRSAGTLIRTPDPNVLWRIAGGSFVERSRDAGTTWQAQMPQFDAHLVAGSAPAAKICWLVGRNGIILLTKDGTKWKTIPPPVPADFVDVAARDASSAMVTAADGHKFSTSDSGKHWNALP
jgi:hypothetical protein